MVKSITTEQDYDEALHRIYDLMQQEIKPSSKFAIELEELSVLVEVYEKEYYKLPKPNTITAHPHNKHPSP